MPITVHAVAVHGLAAIVAVRGGRRSVRGADVVCGRLGTCQKADRHVLHGMMDSALRPYLQHACGQ